MAQLDLKKLSRADQVVVVASAVALVALFLPWYGASFGAFSDSVSGWGTSYGWLGALLVVAAGALLLLVRSGWKMPSLPVGPAVLVLGASALGCLIVIVRWITLPSGSSGVTGAGTYSYGPRIGLFLVVIVGVVQAASSFTLFRSSGEPLPWAHKTPAVAPAAGTTPAAGHEGEEPPS